jgi:hypothetical protein
MVRKKALKPIEVFEANIADAQQLIVLTAALENGRRWTRAERKQSLGEALRIPARDRPSIECVESSDLFVVIKPKSKLGVEHFTEKQLRPMLRQAVVAISASVESYVAVKAGSYASAALRSRPERLKEVPLSLDDVLEIESTYTRRGVGYRAVLVEFLEQNASASPGRIGKVFSTVGHADNLLKRVDRERGTSNGTTTRQLESLAHRRNKIAHTGDRTPSGRAPLTLVEVETYLANANEIVHALEKILP